MTNIYVHADLSEMNLYPCAYSMTFNVTGNRLNAILNQRSQDILAANGWNVSQYAALPKDTDIYEGIICQVPVEQLEDQSSLILFP